MFQNILLLFIFSLASCGIKENTSDKLKLNSPLEERLLSVSAAPPQVDILFVVNDSKEMSVYEDHFNSYIERLLKPMVENQVLNFHVGVISSRKSSRPECLGKRGFQYMARSHVQKIHILRQSLTWERICHGENHIFESTMAFLSSSNGLYRPKASLAIIFITDHGDEGGPGVLEFRDYLLNLKKGQSDKIALYGAIPGSGHSAHCSTPSTTPPLKIKDIIHHFNGLSFNLCSSFFEDGLEELGKYIENKFGTFFVPLKDFPAKDSIQVRYGDSFLEKDFERGWSYNPARKGIYIGRKIPFPYSRHLEITFFPAKF